MEVIVTRLYQSTGGAPVPTPGFQAKEEAGDREKAENTLLEWLDSVISQLEQKLDKK